MQGRRRPWTASQRGASHAACGMAASGAASFGLAGVRVRISSKMCTMCTPSHLPAPPAHFTQRRSSRKAGADNQARWAGAWGGEGAQLEVLERWWRGLGWRMRMGGAGNGKLGAVCGGRGTWTWDGGGGRDSARGSVSVGGGGWGWRMRTGGAKGKLGAVCGGRGMWTWDGGGGRGGARGSGSGGGGGWGWRMCTGGAGNRKLRAARGGRGTRT